MLEAQNGTVPSPSVQSLNFRNKLASLVSPLRRVRPRVPFFLLAAHRVPTLWGLYRGLLRSAPTDNIRHCVWLWFKQNSYKTGTDRAIRELRKGYKWLDTFERAQSGNTKAKTVLERYDRFLQVRAEKESWRQLVLQEVEWQNRLKNRPILTGGFIHPTVYNPPLPRMKPQPMHISRIIVKRIKQREKRFGKLQELVEMREMIRHEQQLERDILELTNGKFEPVFEKQSAWTSTLQGATDTIYENVLAAASRNLRPFSKELLEQVYRARRNKIANKTKERERERRGEILRKTRIRWRKNLTPHLLSTLSEKQRKAELIVQRSIAQVGYVGLLKKRKGWKLKEPKPPVEGKQWSVEDAEWIGNKEREAAKAAFLAIQEANDLKQREFPESASASL